MKETQHALPHHEPETICTTVKMSAKEFRDFRLFLNIIKSVFNDFSLVAGAFRAYSNSRECIVETGFGFFYDMYFDIANIKQFIRLISTFDKKNGITVTINNSSIIFEDCQGPIELTRSNPEYLDNKFISDKEMVETVLNNVDPTKLIVSEAIPKISVRRTNTVACKLNSDRIFLKHDENNLNKGFLLITGGSGDTEFRIELKKPFLIPMKRNHYFELSVLPVLFNKDDLYLKCYFTNDQKIFTIYSAKVNDFFVNIYSKSELIEENAKE